MRRCMIWIPVLMAASALYWTLAIGLGGLSLLAVTRLRRGAPAPCRAEDRPRSVARHLNDDVLRPGF